MLDLYTYELSKIMRDSNNKDFEIIKENCCIAKKNINTDQRPIFLDRRQFRDMHALYSLAIEKTLSDILYEATGNENVYALKMEELFPIFETLMLAKKDSKKLDIAIYSMNLQKRFELSIKKRIQPYIIEKVFKEYHNEFTEYVNERFKNNSKISKEEILYILNPDETDTRVDEFMKDKIKESLVGNLFEE